MQPRTRALLEALVDLAERHEQLMQQDDLLQAARATGPTVTQMCLTDPDARMLPINNEATPLS